MVLPTGYRDDPDIIQDLPLGDGQYDLFVELGGGFLLSPTFSISAVTRYNYQFKSHKNLRYTTSPVGVNELGSDHYRFKEKLGDEISLDLSFQTNINNKWSIIASYRNKYKEKK